MDSLERMEHLREWSSWELAEYTVKLENLLKKISNDFDQDGLPHYDEINEHLRRVYVEDREGYFREYKEL